jgi:prepilin-type processing-associated H-X9-DG protein
VVKVFNSYVMNDAVTENGFGRPGLVRRPSKTVLMAEACKQPDRLSGACGTAPTAVHPNIASELEEVIGWCHCVVPGSKSLIHPWHNGGANFLFVDWHVSFRTQPPPVQDWLP